MLQVLKVAQKLDKYTWKDKQEDLCLCVQICRHVCNLSTFDESWKRKKPKPNPLGGSECDHDTAEAAQGSVVLRQLRRHLKLSVQTQRTEP